MKKQMYNNGLVHVTTSTPTDKLGGILRIDSSSLCNDYCIAMSKCKENICNKCYGITLEKRFTVYGKYCEYNSSILSQKLLTGNELPLFTAYDTVRINGNGELMNGTHYRNIIEIARVNPHTCITIWTKRKELVQRVEKQYNIIVPSNVVKVYSNPKINNPMVNPPKGFDIVFNTFTAEYALEHNIYINCGNKKCIECDNCYHGIKVCNGTMIERCNTVNEIIKSELKKYIKLGGVIW